MLDWLIRTATIASPFLLPLAILIYTKRPTFSFSWRSQHLFMQLFYAMYAFSLLLFVAHAYAVQGGAGEFFAAFWGNPLILTPWCFAAYMAQILSVVALALVVNWGMLRRLNPKLAGTPPLSEKKTPSDQAVAAVEALQQKANSK